MKVRSPEPRDPGALDFAALALASVLPKRAARAVDQGRRDVRVLAGAIRGERLAPVATYEHAVARDPHLHEIDALDALPRPFARRAQALRRDARVVYDSLSAASGRTPSSIVGRALPTPPSW